MNRIILAALVLAALVSVLMATACTTPTTPAATLLSVEGTYSGVLLVEARYNELPRCAAAMSATLAAAPCSDQKVVDQLRKADAVVQSAELAAETVVLNTPAADSAKAMAALDAAIAVVDDIIATYKLK